MEAELLYNFTCFQAGEPVKDLSIVIEDGIIKDIKKTKDILLSFSGKKHNFEGDYLTPGFVDLQVNGGKEYYFTNDLSVEAFSSICTDHLKRGTTSMLPTIVTTSYENLLTSIEVTRKCMEEKETGILGLHLEGPYLNPVKCGAHNLKYIRNPSDYEMDKLLDLGRGIVKKMTIAPEVFTSDMIKKIRNAGIIVSAGHSACSSIEARKAFESGVSCVTHLFNAMPPVKGRESGLVGATMVTDGVFASIIADGHHCSDDSIRLAYKTLKDKLFLISDATFIGTKDMEMDGITFIHAADRYLNGQGKLAGSNITMHDAVVYCINKVGLPVEMVLRMGAEIPLQVLGVNGLGRIDKGYIADLLQIDAHTLGIKSVMKSGRFVNIAN